MRISHYQGTSASHSALPLSTHLTTLSVTLWYRGRPDQQFPLNSYGPTSPTWLSVILTYSWPQLDVMHALLLQLGSSIILDITVTTQHQSPSIEIYPLMATREEEVLEGRNKPGGGAHSLRHSCYNDGRKCTPCHRGNRLVLC